jgi:hypothetical protein
MISALFQPPTIQNSIPVNYKFNFLDHFNQRICLAKNSFLVQIISNTIFFEDDRST